MSNFGGNNAPNAPRLLGGFKTMFLLLALMAITTPSSANGVDSPTRNDIMRLARSSLESGGGSPIALSQRRRLRALEGSTFDRFLQGHTEAYLGSASTVGASATASPEISVTDFGADPTGANLSDAAFDKAMEALTTRCRDSGVLMANNVSDCGGVVLQLGGGAYRLAKPIAFPGFIGNFRMVSGTLRADKTFPRERWQVEVGIDDAQCKADNGQGSCNENVGFEDLMFDGSGVARGGLLINATMGGNAGPDLFFIRFNHSGITVNGGHEVMIHQSWFGCDYYSAKDINRTGSTAIELFGNDHYVSDVVVFNSEIGLVSTGGANLIEGLHCWNDATGRGGHGIISTATSTRFHAIYMDYTALVLQDPTHVSLTDSFFLGMGTLVLRSTTGVVDGLLVQDNTWANWNMAPNDTVVIDERSGTPFSSVTDFIMNGNVGNNKMSARAVKSTRTVSHESAQKFQADFSRELVFPNLPIVSATYSIAISGDAFVRHAMRPPVGLTVSVETDAPVDASVTVSVSQSNYTAGNGF